ncbi:two-component system, response regulator YesN [Ruminococcus sp. YE71]|uniref:hypothetical protein n=1 Tax=unclassified Ruminococcus TaxID=2608920 RepID=UPI000886581F|nr:MULTISPECIES: hypothetical protein [unclassified Ruminococcus]SDA30394.1 two-component system, response regulator YesN [Ruminococcus sp. YE78]SFW49557.1 two-component system, response regulator YesN [Ruminococcus sp. YE71]
MYSVLLLFDDKQLESELRSLTVWGEVGSFEMTSGSYATDLDGLAGHELIIAEKAKGLELLHAAHRQRRELRVELCSRDRDFESARLGIVLGAYDYITAPFDPMQIHSILTSKFVKKAAGK